MNIASFILPIVSVLPKLPEAILSLFFGYLIMKIAMVFLNRFFKVTRLTKALRDLLLSVSYWVFWAIIVSVIARNLGFSQIASTISGSLIVIGFALANGASSLTADVLAGLLLAKDPDFQVGYKIKIGDVEGVIEKMDIRKVRIIDKSKNCFVIANAQVDRFSWTVLSRD